jgi:hypothetical protein
MTEENKLKSEIERIENSIKLKQIKVNNLKKTIRE